MRWGTIVPTLTAALAMLASPGLAVAETKPPALQLTLVRPLFPATIPAGATPLRDAAFAVPSARPGLSLAITDRMGVVASSFKDRTRDRWTTRSPDGQAGRSRTPRGVRLGLVANW
jgi:hypothetical protein